MSMLSCLVTAVAVVAASPEATGVATVLVPIGAAREVDVAEVVARLADATGVGLARPSGTLAMPIVGLAGNLARTMLAEDLGPEVSLRVQGETLVIELDPGLLAAGRRASWEQRLRKLASSVEREIGRRAQYGMHALGSYRPNDPARPTVCLVHGMNSSSGGFVHMIRPLEEAGFGVVVYDYAFNRDLKESCARFARDWAAFRLRVGETRPWALVGHSMGALVARSYVEDPEAYAGDVSTLILLAPVNQGSSLAKAQTLMQLLDGVRAVNGKKKGANALASLADGLGEAADDILPGSAFLKALNARPRRAGVSYHILAGDAGFLSSSARRQIEDEVALLRRGGGLLGGLARLASGDLLAGLDELCDGTGDGCVAVDRTRLEGVTDHVTIRANHAELIRAPLLYPDPGPVACMPQVLRWLGDASRSEAMARPAGAGPREEAAVRPGPSRP
jgi:pimeloyl-ACP methyl ester carboxylesterase